MQEQESSTSHARGTRPQSGLAPVPCEICGTVFEPYRSWTTTCSRSCREKAPKRDKPWAKEKEVTCKRCSEQFIVMDNGGRYSYCPACKPSIVRASNDRKNVARRIATDPTNKGKHHRNSLRKYGLTPEQLAEMVEAQGNRCAICGEQPDPNGVRAASRLHVDHCHTTGRNRALLCGRCNAGLGHFRDDPALFLAAVEYLKFHS